MAEWKDMTVQALRELARKALGRGHSQFRTKVELIEALEAAGAQPGKAGEEPGRSPRSRQRRTASRRAGAAGRAATEAPAEPSAAKEAKRAGPTSGKRARRAGDQAEPAGKGKGKSKGKGKGKGKPVREPGRRRAGGKAAAAAARSAPQPAGEAQAPARRALAGGTEPDPEGYMVARVAGEEALRGAPHPMTESALDSARKAPPPGPLLAVEGAEVLGELPWSYGEDVLVALPRDPTTLFLYWDHAPETLRQAWAGLDGGRPQLRVLAREGGGEWTSERRVEFALESRSYYVHDLLPGRAYRVEIHLVDRTGRDVLLARPSNEVHLPPSGPSPVVDDRFMVLPWSEPLPRLLREARPGGPFSEDLRAQLARLSDWSRFAGRAWGGWGASAGGMGGRPFSPVSSPSSPMGVSGRPDGKGR